MSYQIDWSRLTLNEAQEIIDLVLASCKAKVKLFNHSGLHEISYIEVESLWDFTNDLPTKTIEELSNKWIHYDFNKNLENKE